ncbi:MAG: Dehydrogenase [Marinobacter excellens HL-55]|uniref:Dehydrogenase n=1 Tax=Marinobacter excellens HL-55 TaxID=1305731 RepID=A0A0P8B1E1_9GAMM|nr:MAG: Dehydrogenase [Marinobacter excellens HL-55]
MESTQRVALVTGGAKGIGRGIVLHLAAAGWKVVFCDTDQAAGEQLVTKHAVPHLRHTRGAIVNMASTRALQSEPDTEAYAATKGGIVALTHALAVSLGPNIRVNCISPGWIDTRAWQGGSDEVEALSQADHHQHPAGRVGTPEDIAALVAYLISPQASFITGQNVVADGGMVRKMIYEE